MTNPECKRCGLLRSTVLATGHLCAGLSTVNAPPHDFGEIDHPTPSLNQSDAKAIEEFEDLRRQYSFQKMGWAEEFILRTRQEARIEELEWLRGNVRVGKDFRDVANSRITSLKNER